MRNLQEIGVVVRNEERNAHGKGLKCEMKSKNSQRERGKEKR